MSLEKGCRVAVETCMGVTPKDHTLVVSDEGSKNIGEKLKDILLETTPHVRYFNLDIYGERPLKKLPLSIEKAAFDATAVFWTAKAVEGELENVRGPFMKAAIFNGRLAHMVNITEEIVETGLTADYNKVEKFTNKIQSMLKGVKEIKVKTDRGTNLDIKVGKYKWVATTGILRLPGEWHNLPDGMVYTVPEEMEGKAIIDGTLGDYFDSVYSLSTVEESPLKIKIENGKPPQYLELECANPDIEADIKEYMGRNQCSSYVGEIGFGTNLFLDRLIGSMLLDEKCPGFHIAFGDPNQDMTFAGWTCPEHIDMVIQRCNVWFDGKKIMENGKYLPDITQH